MNNKTIITSFIWKFMERIGIQGIQFIVQIFLARILVPGDFGTVALITIFISVANVFVQSGFNTALIQRKDVTEADYSSVFILSIGIAFVLYILLFISSPLIASFYKTPILESVIKVLAITLFFGAFNSIQVAKISRDFEFKKLFLSSIGAYIVSGFVGVLMAFNGLGVWAIVAQQLVSQFGVTIILYFIVDWKPRLIFDLTRLKVLFSFGSKMLISNLIDTIYNNIYGLVIGKCYSSTQLGFYNRADQFPQIVVVNINGSIQSVILPVLSKEQDNKVKLKGLMRRAMLTSSFIVFPLMAGLAVCAEPIISILLTDAWLPSAPLMQLLCVSYAFWPIHTANLQAISAMGRSDIFLKLEVIKKIVGIVLLIASIPFGLEAMVGVKIISGVIGLIINSYPNKKLLDYGYMQQIKDLLPNAVITIFMYFIVFIVSGYLSMSILSLLIQVSVGVITYLVLSYVFKIDSLFYMINMIKSMREKS